MHGCEPPTVPFRRHRQSAITLLAAVTLLVAACGAGASTDSSTPASGEDTSTTSAQTGASSTSTTENGPATLRVGWPESNTTLEMGAGVGTNDWIPLENVYDNLTFRGRTGEAEPAIAESWEFNEDATAVDLTIRQGVLFHNGEELTAEDVAYSIRRILEPGFPGDSIAAHHADVLGAEVIADSVVRVTFASSDPLWVHNSPSRTPIIPKSLGEELGYEFGKTPETAVGTGPYRVVEWQLDQLLALEAFPEHWRGEAAIQRVEFVPLPNAAARAAALIAGDVDVVSNLPIEQVEAVETAAGVEVITVPSVGRMLMTFNAHMRPGTPLEDVRVREALALALDLQSVIDNILDGYGELVPIHTLPFEVGFNPDLQPYGYDPDRARQLLTEAGYPDGFDGLSFLARTQDQKAEEVAQAFQAMWADIGVGVSIEMLGNEDLQNRHRDEDVDMSMFLHRGGATFHAQHGLQSPYGCEGGSAVWARKFCNEEAADIILRQAPEALVTDPERAEALFREAQRILHEDFANPGVWYQPYLYGMSDRVDWMPYPTGDAWIFEAKWRS